MENTNSRDIVNQYLSSALFSSELANFFNRFVDG